MKDFWTVSVDGEERGSAWDHQQLCVMLQSCLKKTYIGEISFKRQRTEKEHCHATDEGYCDWDQCPQILDGEPKKSCRDCPLDYKVEMKTVIAGSRDFLDYDHLCEVMKKIDWTPTLIISGTARGADKLGERWAEEHNVPIKRMPANWDKYGRSAGHRRNAEMIAIADAAVIMWDGKSKGTKNTIGLVKEKKIKQWIDIYTDPISKLKF